MPRTTIDIDPTVLRELKRRAHAEGTTVGRLVSRLVATSLSDERTTREPPRFEWTTAPMRALVDLRDKEALNRTLDGR
jgi:hypothetical protein